MDEKKDIQNGEDLVSEAIKAAKRCFELYGAYLEMMENMKEEYKQFEEQEAFIWATSEFDAEAFDWEFVNSNK